MGPERNRPKKTFDSQKIRGQPACDQGAFWPDLKRFFWPKVKKVENFDILGEIFQT